jgi:hypothetical protein
VKRERSRSMATYQEKPWLKSYEKGVPEFVKYEDL